MVFLRPGKPPRHLLDAIAVPKGAKLLESASLKDGHTWLIATTLGLAVLRDDVAQFHRWDQIDRAVLRRRGAVLAITLAGQTKPELFAIQPRDKRLASIVSECLTASVIETEHVALPDGQVIIALRRNPADQSVYLEEIVEPGVDRAAAQEAVKAARERLGEAGGLPPVAW
ncbi:MAG: hypothetical protein LBJ62_00935 [Bifidobacteriaceae bacterium]|jgi:hypothetical protein|nr:hypothetical protein [Bifidobacteriaceae bacterium]